MTGDRGSYRSGIEQVDQRRRGSRGAYTVGLGVVSNLAVFPYHGTAAGHLRDRSIDLLPTGAVLAGIDEETALIKQEATWTVAGAGAVTIYGHGDTKIYVAGATVEGLAT